MRQARLLSNRSRFHGGRFFHALSSPELRRKFLTFYEQQGHTVVPSASLVPHNDKSLLFTNAGMVPFKEYFMNPTTAPFGAAASVQKCMRAGGKHNDLDNVGFTPRHHTFFEMLGNFSFGQYTKKDAIAYAWRFLTKELGLPTDRLRVSILEADEEGRAMWRAQGLPDEKIIQCGMEDNFWSMGDGEGPCGPCTEIFWDTHDDTLDDRWLEIWNLVFMEKYRASDGKMTDLPVPCIDTGMGLERIASVLQRKQNNFQIDQFQHLFRGLDQVLHGRGLRTLAPDQPTAHAKIIADHFRAMCFLIGDGVVPSNIGRGYVLRRIIRRALRSARQLGIHDPFLTELYPNLLEGFSDDLLYPELSSRAASICSVITNEERSFLATLDRGMALLEGVFNQADLQHTKSIPPAVAFQLYDTFGFPFDLTLIIAQERGWTVDMKAVEKLQERQKSLGRESWKKESSGKHAHWAAWRQKQIVPRFTGYDHALLHQQESQVVAMHPVPSKSGRIQADVVIDPCPFYGMGGGQVPDSGTLMTKDGGLWQVVDVFQPYEGGLVLRVKAQGEQQTASPLQVGQLVKSQVDLERRQGAEIHHTATHLLNAGLRAVLNVDIVQAGSTVEPDKLRFDFTYGKPLSAAQMHSIEEWVNTAAWSGAGTLVQHMTLAKAVSSGAIAAFTEKYGDTVRVIEVPGVSKELCGGTHVDNVRKLFPFKIMAETSVAAGTRRIEAVAGASCVSWYRQAYEPIPNMLRLLRAHSTVDAVDKLQKAMQHSKELQKRLERVTEKLASAPSLALPVETTFKEIPVQIHWINDPDLDASFMQKRANVLRDSETNAAHVIVNGTSISVSMHDSLTQQTSAHSILKYILKHVKGGGGGQRELAQGRLADRIADADTLVRIFDATRSSHAE